MKTGKAKGISLSVVLILIFLMMNYQTVNAERDFSLIPDEMYDSLGYIISKPDTKSKIIDSLEDKEDLSEGDIVYINIGSKQGAKAGDRYTVYKPVKSVLHPASKKEVGYLIRILGFLEVQVVRENKSRAVITKSYYAISLNHPIEKYKEISRKPKDVFPEDKLRGYIIVSKDLKLELGKEDIIYIDKGLKDGVQPMDMFEVLDEKEKDKEPINPPKGEIVILSVQDKTAAGIIEKSTKEIEIGDVILYKGRGIK